MRAAIFTGPGKLKVGELTELAPDKGRVVVRMEYCGICGSDVHAYRNGAQHTVMMRGVMGHEFGGVVEDVGEGVEKVKVGDRVTAISMGGGFAERWAIPEEAVYPLPENISTRVAALVEPLAVALRGVNRAAPKKEDRIVVIGAGPVGLLVVAVLKSRGFDGVIVSEPAAARRDMAIRMGAAEALDPQIFRERAGQLHGMEGVSLAFECAGLKDTMDCALEIAGRGGRILVLGAFTERYPLSPMRFLVKEISIIASFGYEAEFGQAIELISSGKVNPEPLITEEVPLKDINEGFERLARGESGLIKALVKL